MILPIYTALTKLDNSLIQASADLGADKAQTFRRIILPLSMAGVYSGIAMVFMPAVTTFVITKLLGGGQQNMIGNIIEDQFMTAGNWSFGSALSAVLMVVILIFMAVSNRLNPSDEQGGGLI